MRNIKSNLLVSIVLAMFMLCMLPLMAFAADPATIFAAQPGTNFERGHSQNGIVPMEVYSQDGLIEMLAVPESSFPEVFSIVPASLQEFEVVKLVDNGPDSENIVISILGDGFTASQQDYFVDSARMVSEYLLNFHPFALFKDSFNVYAVKVISNVSGAAARPTELIDNYFGSTFYYDGVTQRLLYTTYTSKVNDVLRTYTPKYDMPVVIVNSTTYGGGGGTFAVTSLEASAKEILVHELGHSAGGLADEYWWRGYEAPNLTRDNNALTNKWRHWLGFESVGMYPHAESPTWFRPHQNCEMRYLNRQFCGVCATELTRRMANIVNEPFYGRTNISDATIPHGKTRIVDYTYYGCEALATVTIPSTVSFIGRYSFLRCENLTSITNYARTPQLINNTTFAGVSRSNITLNVPYGTTGAYLSVGWTGFKEIIEMPPLTYANLFASVQGETSAAAAYRAFAVKAQEEGYPVIAQLFRATADAEEKHAADEWAILLTMGATEGEKPVAETPIVGTTAQNLQAAFDGETYEYTVMYPDFRAIALEEGFTAAASIFRLALEAERIHAGNYKDVLDNLSNRSYVNGKYAIVFRCIICGEVVTTRPNRCPICFAAGDTFIEYRSTYANLFASVQGETSAAAAYRAFAVKAQEEGYPVIAQLFRATADAEEKHAADEWAILLTMGATEDEKPVAETPVVGTTAQNLQAAFDGETYEYTVMYPDFRAIALAEGNAAAASIFRLALEAERIHAGNYMDVLDNLSNKIYIKSTYSVIFRCIICGEVVTSRPNRCPICFAAGDTFVEYAYLPIKVIPTASVEKLTGNKNYLTITITEYYADGYIDVIIKTFSIDNNAADTYVIEDYKVYKVYVDTKGNTQIRECYIVE